MARKYATADAVDLAGLLEFIRPRHRMVLTTFRADGSLQSSPVTGGVDDAGRIVIASYPQRAKSANLRRDGRASVVVLSDEFDGPYLQVDGDGEVIDLPDAVEPLVDYFRAIAGEHPDWAEYRQAMAEQGKCLLRLTPSRWARWLRAASPRMIGEISDSGVEAVEVERDRACRVGAELSAARGIGQLAGARRYPQVGAGDAIAIRTVVQQDETAAVAADRPRDVLDADEQGALVGCVGQQPLRRRCALDVAVVAFGD